MIESLKESISKYSPKIERNDGDERWYRIPGETKWLPSVTTMIGSVLNKGEGFEKWLGDNPSYDIACEKRDKSAELGTLVHDQCEKLLKGETIIEKQNKSVMKRLMSFVAWYRSKKPIDVIATELKLVHKNVPYSGTPDIVCYIDNKLCLVDIKTGAPYESHQLQLTSYKTLWDNIFPNHTIDKMYGLYLKDTWISKIEPNFKEYKYCPEEVECVYKLWKWQKGGNPRPKNGYPLHNSFKLQGINSEKPIEEIL
tara:strand:- start:25655 stop:26416 length:762 start_codon:yes stop_codon:yes gene_type:complete